MVAVVVVVVVGSKRCRAVKEMPKPFYGTELQSFLLYIQSLANFIPNQLEVIAPLKQLLEKNISYYSGKRLPTHHLKMEYQVVSTLVLSLTL